MVKKSGMDIAILTNRIILGLLMLIPGIFNIIAIGDVATSFPYGAFWAWVLVLSQLVFGLAVLIGWKMKYTALPPALILILAASLVWWTNWPQVLLHFAAASNYVVFSVMDWKK